MIKYGMAELMEAQARAFVEKKLSSFSENERKRYLNAVLAYIYSNYPSFKDAA